MKIIIQLVFFLACNCCLAQEFSISNLELTLSGITIHYNLVDTVKARTYTIHVYSSVDKYLNPLQKVSGDIGLEVSPGINKKIVWNALEELGSSFKGDVELEVRGRVYVPFIRFEGFQDIEVRKRNVPFNVKWSGGTRQNVLNFQLYNKENKLVHVFPNVGNEFEYKVIIPTSVKPGADYYFRISDSRNKDQVVVTPSFSIRRRVPLAVKGIPLIATGITLYMLLQPGDDVDLVASPPLFPPGK